MVEETKSNGNTAVSEDIKPATEAGTGKLTVPDVAADPDTKSDVKPAAVDEKENGDKGDAVVEESKPAEENVVKSEEKVKTEENVKSEEEQVIEVDESKKEKILTQLEFYFGDVNLPKDAFMKGEMAKSDGWIEVTTMLKFNRLKNLLDGFAEKQHVPILLDVLKNSSLIEVDPPGNKLRRCLQFPAPEGRAEEKTVYLKNFSKTETTLDELLDHFKSKYEGVEGIIMRNYNRKTFEGGEFVFKREFKGSIFVVFKTVEQAEILLNEEKTSYKGVELLKMMQKEHSAKKLADLQARTEARKKKKEQQQHKDDEPEESENAVPELPENIFVKVLSVPEGLSREDIKATWASLFDDKEKYQIAFIDFNRGEKDAVLRLDRANAAKEAIELLSKTESPGKIGLGPEKILCEVRELEEKEEEDHRAQVSQKQQMRLNQRKRQGGNRGRGRGRGHKRQRRY